MQNEHVIQKIGGGFEAAIRNVNNSKPIVLYSSLRDTNPRVMNCCYLNTIKCLQIFRKHCHEYIRKDFTFTKYRSYLQYQLGHCLFLIGFHI